MSCTWYVRDGSIHKSGPRTYSPWHKILVALDFLFVEVQVLY